MKIRYASFGLTLLLFSHFAWAQAPKFETFVGYSWLSLDSVQAGQRLENNHGAQASGTYYFRNFRGTDFGVTVDAGAQFRDTGRGASVGQTWELMAGPQFRWSIPRGSVFAHYLLGATRLVSGPEDSWDFSMGAGGGWDLDVVRGEANRFALRVVQFDYIPRFNDELPRPLPQEDWKHHFRVAGGFVFKFR